MQLYEEQQQLPVTGRSAEFAAAGRRSEDNSSRRAAPSVTQLDYKDRYIVSLEEQIALYKTQATMQAQEISSLSRQLKKLEGELASTSGQLAQQQQQQQPSPSAMYNLNQQQQQQLIKGGGGGNHQMPGFVNASRRSSFNVLNSAANSSYSESDESGDGRGAEISSSYRMASTTAPRKTTLASLESILQDRSSQSASLPTFYPSQQQHSRQQPQQQMPTYSVASTRNNSISAAGSPMIPSMAAVEQVQRSQATQPASQSNRTHPYLSTTNTSSPRTNTYDRINTYADSRVLGPACDGCRLRKRKCDRVKPHCSYCIKLSKTTEGGAICTYPHLRHPSVGNLNSPANSSSLPSARVQLAGHAPPPNSSNNLIKDEHHLTPPNSNPGTAPNSTPASATNVSPPPKLEITGLVAKIELVGVDELEDSSDNLD